MYYTCVKNNQQVKTFERVKEYNLPRVEINITKI